MRTIATVAVLAGALAATPPPEVRPLRTLVYDVQVAIGNRLLEHNSGFGNAMSGSDVVSVSGTGRSTYTAGSEARGTITADVIAATADNYLVVDIAERASERNRAKVRVAIGNDGGLRYDPAQAPNLTAEELTLLRWLARGFRQDVPAKAGIDVEIPQTAPGTSGAEHYRSTALAGDAVKLDYRMEMKRGGVNGYDFTRVGALTYDPSLSVPLEARYQEIAHQERPGTVDTTETSVVLKLVSDTFAQKRAAAPAPK